MASWVRSLSEKKRENSLGMLSAGSPEAERENWRVVVVEGSWLNELCLPHRQLTLLKTGLPMRAPQLLLSAGFTV